MTGSELAGHRLLEVLVAPCCGTALLARRGGLVPPLNRTPTARRSAPPPAPSGGWQCRAIGPAGGIGKYPSGLFWGSGRSPPLRSKRGDSRCAAGATPSKRGRPRHQTPKKGRRSEASIASEDARPSGETWSDLTLPRLARAEEPSPSFQPTRPAGRRGRCFRALSPFCQPSRRH